MIVAIEAPHFCAGLEVLDGRIGSWCAPILRWAQGKPWPEVRAYCLRKGWKVTEWEQTIAT